MAEAISYIMAQEGCKVLAYVDDFLVVAEWHMAQKFYNRLSDLFIELGLPMNMEKRTPPSKILTCLGISIDIETNTLSIDREKLLTTHEECLQVAAKKYLTKRAFQLLLGKLIYVHKCVVPARIFINRMLVIFRENAHKSIEHIEGKKNVIADLLSRLYSSEGVNKASILLLKQKFIWISRSLTFT